MLSGKIQPAAGRRSLTKPTVLSFACGEAAGLNRPRERLLSVTAVYPEVP